jgi:hypothetical protein
MARHDKIISANACFPVQVHGVKLDIGQLEIGGAATGICDRGGRTVDPDELLFGIPAGEKGGQNADAATEIQDCAGRKDTGRHARTDGKVIFVALTVESGDEGWVGRRIVKGGFFGGSCAGRVFSGNTDVKSVELRCRDDLALPGEIGGVGCEVPEPPILEMGNQRSARLMVVVARIYPSYPVARESYLEDTGRSVRFNIVST